MYLDWILSIEIILPTLVWDLTEQKVGFFIRCRLYEKTITCVEESDDSSYAVALNFDLNLAK